MDPTRLRLTDPPTLSGVLLGTRCDDCGIHQFGTALFCQACSSANQVAVELGAQGTLYSYTVVHVPPAGWPGPSPYILGEVELPEGPHVLAEIVDCPRELLQVGLAIELDVRAVQANETSLPLAVYKWRPGFAATEEAPGGAG